MQETAPKIYTRGKSMVITNPWSAYHQAFASQYYSCPLPWYQKCNPSDTKLGVMGRLQLLVSLQESLVKCSTIEIVNTA